MTRKLTAAKLNEAQRRYLVDRAERDGLSLSQVMRDLVDAARVDDPIPSHHPDQPEEEPGDEAPD